MSLKECDHGNTIMKMALKKITIHDLARELKLSPGTISKILNGQGTIPDTTRKRVIHHAKIQGYVPSHSARILKAKHSWTIGVVFSDIASFGLEHPFFGSIIQAFKNYVEDKGYEIVFIPKRLGHLEQSYLQWANNKHVDGVLVLTGDINSKDMQELVQSHIPCVSTDIIMPGLSTVISDDHQGIDIIFQHYLSQGYKRIFAYSGSILSRAYQERTEAYQKLIKKHHLTIPSYAYAITEQYGVQSAYDYALKWIETWKTKPEAIIAFSDDIAIGLIRALKEKGYRVPEDIAVSGYDDIQFAQYHQPSLTTIKQNKRWIAESAAEKLLKQIVSQKPETSVTRIPVSLMKRQSTR